MKRASVYLTCALIVSLVGGGFFALSARAQMTPQDAAQVNTQDISVSTTPDVPGPYQDVTITLGSYITDLNRAYVSWNQDGNVALAGIGKYAYTFTTGGVGQTTNIRVTIALISGEIITKNLSFNPAELDVLWEGADAYTPPFYRGRAMPTAEGVVRVVAIPQIQNGKALLPQGGYVFSWKKNDNVMSEDSGYGKSAFVYQKDYLNDIDDVQVTAQDNNTGAEAQLDIPVPVFDAQILMYASDPITGIDWDHELGSNYTVGSADKTIIAIPYFYTPADPLDSSLTYAWTINGDPIDTPAIENMLTLKSGGTNGVSDLALKITSATKLFLSAEKDITINLTK